jgi:hypothetical protein
MLVMLKMRERLAPTATIDDSTLPIVSICSNLNLPMTDEFPFRQIPLIPRLSVGYNCEIHYKSR